MRSAVRDDNPSFGYRVEGVWHSDPDDRAWDWLRHNNDKAKSAWD